MQNHYPTISAATLARFGKACRKTCLSVPDICGVHGKSCRQLDSEEGANRILCESCDLQVFANNTQAGPWQNFGDIHYLDYGGYLVRKDPEIDGRYQVFRMDTEIDVGEPENISARLYTVDIEDITSENLTDMLYAVGLEDDEHVVGKSREEIIAALSPERVVKEVIDCLGGPYVDCITYTTRYPQDFDDTLLTKPEVIKWLILLGADEYVEEG